MNRWRAAGDNGEVVRVGQAGHDTVGHGAEPLRHKSLDVGDDTVPPGLIEVGRVATVYAHDDHRAARPAVGHAVQGHGSVIGCTHSPRTSPLDSVAGCRFMLTSTL